MNMKKEQSALTIRRKEFNKYFDKEFSIYKPRRGRSGGDKWK